MRENLDNRKRGVKLLELWAKTCGAVQWCSAKDEKLYWFKFEHGDPELQVGEAIAAICKELDKTKCNYQCDGCVDFTHDGAPYRSIKFTIFFDAEEMLTDEELKPIAEKLRK